MSPLVNFNTSLLFEDVTPLISSFKDSGSGHGTVNKVDGPAIKWILS